MIPPETFPPSTESLYGMIQREAWEDVLGYLHGVSPEDGSDPRLGHVIETFIGEYFRALPAILDEPPPDEPPPDNVTDAARDGASVFRDARQMDTAEHLVLFHAAGRLPLSDTRFRDLIIRLVRHHGHRKDRALDFARFLPREPICAELLRRYAVPEKRSTPSVRNTGVHVTEQTTVPGSQALLGLFRSAQEERFFAAVKRRFPEYIAVPNAAMHAFISIDAIETRLRAAEKDFFFRALVDLVLFDPRKGNRAVACFEIDSPLHDDDRQIGRDEMKDRILSAAGVKLYRIRPDRIGVEESKFSEVLESIGPI